MRTEQNIYNMITMSLCLIMAGTIIFIVNVHKDLEQQIFEVDNLQGREDSIKVEIEKLKEKVFDITSYKENIIKSARDIYELEIRIKDMESQNTNTDKDMTSDELNAEIDRQIKALNKEIENAK